MRGSRSTLPKAEHRVHPPRYVYNSQVIIIIIIIFISNNCICTLTTGLTRRRPFSRSASCITGLILLVGSETLIRRTSACTATASQRMLARMGSREVHELAGGSGRNYKSQSWELGRQLAGGVRLAPYIPHKGVNLWTDGGPARAMYGVSKSEWMEADNLLDWFTKLFVPSVDHLLHIQALYCL